MARVLFVLSLVLMALTFVLGRLWRNTPLLFVGSIVFGIGVVGMFVFRLRERRVHAGDRSTTRSRWTRTARSGRRKSAVQDARPSTT